MSDPIKVLDHGFVRLVDHMGADLDVARAARVEPDADWRDGEGTGTDRGLIGFMMRHGHNTPFEQVVFKFEVKAPIFVFRQWHRHRTQSINEISARYAPLPDEFYVPDLDVIGTQAKTNKQARDIGETDAEMRGRRLGRQIKYRRHCENAFALYHELLDDGWPRELARCVLPVAIYSRMIFTVNLHNLLRFLAERAAPEAQYEIRVYALAIIELIRPVVPVCIEAWERNRNG